MLEHIICLFLYDNKFHCKRLNYVDGHGWGAVILKHVKGHKFIEYEWELTNRLIQNVQKVNSKFYEAILS
jgi:hypothetical protein